MSAQTKRPNQIFICYRREDTAGVVGRIYDRLVQRFGKDAIFKDVDSLPLGRDFRRHIDSVVSECCAALVVVGDRWIGTSGASRLDDPRDYVRIEIESALKRDIPVIPLLVQNAELPPDASLPESLKDFAYRNGMSIGHDPHFHADMDRLIKHLEALIDERAGLVEAQSPAPATGAEAERDKPTGEPESGKAQHSQNDLSAEPVRSTAEAVPEGTIHIGIVPPEAQPAPVVRAPNGSPQTAGATSESKRSATQIQFWIAEEDRRRIVLLYLSLWIGVGLINTVYVLVAPRLAIVEYLTNRSIVVLLTTLLLATGQVTSLKGYIGPARRWISPRWIAYTVGASVVSNLLILVLSPEPPLWVLVLQYDVPRAALQWLLLRKQVSRASLWIVANLVAGILYGLAASAWDVSYWTPAQSFFVASLRTPLTAAAEILCLVTFHRKH